MAELGLKRPHIRKLRRALGQDEAALEGAELLPGQQSAEVSTSWPVDAVDTLDELNFLDEDFTASGGDPPLGVAPLEAAPCRDVLLHLLHLLRVVVVLLLLLLPAAAAACCCCPCCCPCCCLLPAACCLLPAPPLAHADHIPPGPDASTYQTGRLCMS